MAFQDLTGQAQKYTDILPEGFDLIVPLKSVELFAHVRPCLAPLIFLELCLIFEQEYEFCTDGKKIRRY